MTYSVVFGHNFTYNSMYISFGEITLLSTKSLGACTPCCWRLWLWCVCVCVHTTELL